MITKLALAAAAISASAAPALAAPAGFCHLFARIAHDGAADGERMAPLLDGLEAAIIGFDADDETQVRIVAGVYLAGYSQGLMKVSEPSEAAAEFYAGCMAEGA